MHLPPTSVRQSDCLCLNLRLYSSKCSTKHARSLLSLAGDIRLNFFPTTDPQIVEDFGIENDLPDNPFLFVCPPGTLKALPKHTILLYHPDKEVKFDGKQRLIHNNRGVYHELKWKPRTGELALSTRREDIEIHNVQSNRSHN